jgi:16S rRNA (cytosine967-C5)-methyltransferase
VNSRRFSSVEIRELEEFREGLLYPQSLAAMTTVRVLNPQRGETIVDMNCAPGGKLSHISQLMENSGRIYGFDRNSEKISQTRQTLAKLGCRNVTVSIHDSRYIHEDLPDLQADRVLVDPPCTALGLRPKLYDFSDAKRIRNLSSYQLQFLSAASKIVKPGGTVVYSVCTFTPEECEQVVGQATKSDLKVVDQHPIVASSRGLSSSEFGKLCQRFHPHKDEIGFFIAKFERVNT